MQYMLLLYSKEDVWSRMPQDAQDQAMAAYRAFTEALKTAGAYKAGSRLQFSSSATTVRVTDGRPQVLNGPYVDSKEQLGGYYLIEAPDLDAALAWAARCPGAGHGIVEVRPLWTTPA